ncbi:MAG: hypothetical protein KF718_27155 [Polyangiaceae bacterium]|nr:hypothetical protein [Polyangiaceae bacterium]
MKTSALWLMASWAALAVACKDKPAENPPPSCPPGTGWNGAACVAMTGPGPGPTATTTATTPPPDNTTPLPIPTVQPGPAATPIDPTLAAAAGPAIDALAAQHAQGMSVVTTVAGNFGPGQTLTVDFQADPGRCYVAFASGLPGVTEVDLQISPAVSMPGVPAPILAQDQTTGPTAVLGAKPNCFKWAAPMGAPMRLTVRGTQGQGVIAARLYMK